MPINGNQRKNQEHHDTAGERQPFKLLTFLLQGSFSPRARVIPPYTTCTKFDSRLRINLFIKYKLSTRSSLYAWKSRWTPFWGATLALKLPKPRLELHTYGVGVCTRRAGTISGLMMTKPSNQSTAANWRQCQWAWASVFEQRCRYSANGYLDVLIRTLKDRSNPSNLLITMLLATTWIHNLAAPEGGGQLLSSPPPWIF